jgi:hypothetical protein
LPESTGWTAREFRDINTGIQKDISPAAAEADLAMWTGKNRTRRCRSARRKPLAIDACALRGANAVQAD